MKTIYFIRHGQSLSNVGGVTMEHASIPLTPIGHQQANALALMLPQDPPEVLVSPFLRAQETAEPYLKRTQKHAWTQQVLREFEAFDTDLMAGMNGEQRRPLADAYWDQEDQHARMGPKGETFAEFESRVATFQALSLPNLKDGSLVFGHGMWIALLIWRTLGFDVAGGLGMKRFRRFQIGFPIPNGAVYGLTETTSGHWSIRAEPVIIQQMLSLARR